jgi:hypothetical protein
MTLQIGDRLDPRAVFLIEVLLRSTMGNFLKFEYPICAIVMSVGLPYLPPINKRDTKDIGYTKLASEV